MVMYNETSEEMLRETNTLSGKVEYRPKKAGDENDDQFSAMLEDNRRIEFGIEYTGTSGSGSILRIGYPKALHDDVYNALKSVRPQMEAKNSKKYKWFEGYAENACKMFVMMCVFDWIREYPQKYMVNVLDTTTMCLTWIHMYMEEAGIADIDMSQVNNKDKKPAQWRVILPQSFDTGSYSYDGSDLTVAEYDITGTVFSRVFDRCRVAQDMELRNGGVYVPKKNISSKLRTGEEFAPPADLPYISDYSLLTYRFKGNNLHDLMQEAYIVDTCVSNFGRLPVYKSGRIYNSFHNLPSAFRSNVEYNGSPLVELFDLPCSFYTMSVGMILEKWPDIDIFKLKEFFYTCLSGDFYTEVAESIGETRETAKKKLQGWRNCWRYAALYFEKFGFKPVTDYMDMHYPEIAAIYYGWPRRKNGNRIVKNLQVDYCEFETRLMSRFARMMKDTYGVTCFLLHDAAYVSQAEKDTLPDNINKVIKRWFEYELFLKYNNPNCED